MPIATIGSTAKRLGSTTLSGSGSQVTTPTRSEPVENLMIDASPGDSSNIKSYSPGGGNAMTQNSQNSSQVGVRNWMNNAGFDNSKIGYSNGTVTYNGQDFIKPSSVNNGVSVASGADLTRAANDYYANNGYYGVRDTLTDRGVADNRIGYNADTGSILIDGIDTNVRPDVNANGTTYGTEGDVNELTNAAYRSAGEELAAVRDYADSRGYGGLVSWDGNNVSIGGISIAPTYVTESGRAYIRRSDIDNAIDQLERSNGILGNDGVVSAYDNKYGATVDNALNRILERDEFNYDPETDIVYQAYENMYKRYADEALRDILEENNTSVFGASGAVLAEAMANRNRYLQELTDIIPTVAADAYDRYQGETSRLNQNLDQTRTVSNDYYGRLYQQNRDAYNDMMSGIQYGDQEDQRWIDNYRQFALDDLNRRAAEEDITSAQLANELSRLNNDQTRFSNYGERAYYRGSYTPEEAAYIGVSPDSIPWQGQMDYTLDNNLINSYGSSLGQAAANAAASRINAGLVSALASSSNNPVAVSGIAPAVTNTTVGMAPNIYNDSEYSNLTTIEALRQLAGLGGRTGLAAANTPTNLTLDQLAGTVLNGGY